MSPAWAIRSRTWCLTPSPGLPFPLRWQKSSSSIARHANSSLIQFLPIPKFTSHLSVRLIQSFAVIRIRAAANFITPAELHFDEPIGIGQSLTRQSRNVGVSSLQNCFSLFEGSNAAGGDDWRRESGGVHRVFDFSDQRN